MRCAAAPRLTLLAALALAACLPERAPPSPSPYPGAEAFGPQRITAERMACEARGGRFVQAGMAGRLVCQTTPRDAGRSCARPADCEVACLARSRTCAPVAPLFGCHEVVQADGSVATLCLD
jgi:hypothetical protein